MNVVAAHRQMVRNVFLNVELLLNDGIRELSEYDVQGMMFLAFRTALTNSGWRADRETNGKVDCVVFEGTTPRAHYEIKTYFKPREKLRLVDFQKDLKKLQTSKVRFPGTQAFFFVAASKAKVKESALASIPSLRELVHAEGRVWKVFDLGDDTKVRLRPSRREQYGRSIVITWEVK